MNELEKQIEEMAKKLERELPVGDLTAEKVKRAQELMLRMQNRNTNLPNGHIANPFSQSASINDLREILKLCKEILIPYEMKKQIGNLRNVGRLAGAK